MQLCLHAVHLVLQVLRMITDRLKTDNHDDTIISILHLLVSELGSYNESTFEVHIQGLHQLARGISEFPPRSAVFMNLYVSADRLA